MISPTGRPTFQADLMTDGTMTIQPYLLLLVNRRVAAMPIGPRLPVTRDGPLYHFCLRLIPRPRSFRASVIVCTRGRARDCACGREANLLCDFPIAAGRTCDAPICGRCATHIGRDTDYCPRHSNLRPAGGAA